MLGQINAATVNGVLLNGSGQENFRYASAAITQADATAQASVAASVDALLASVAGGDLLAALTAVLVATDSAMTAGTDSLSSELSIGAGAALDQEQAADLLIAAALVSVASMAEYTQSSDVLSAWFRSALKRKVFGSDVAPHGAGSGLTRHPSGSSLTVH